MKPVITKTVTALILALSFQAKANLKDMVAEMNAFQKPQVEALRKVLTNDAELKSDYKMYLSEISALSKVKDDETRFKMAISINQKHKGTFEKAQKKAKINPEHNKKKAAELSRKYSIKDIRYVLLPGEFLTYAAWLERHEHEAPPAETEVTFGAPFSFEHSSSLSIDGATVDLETGRFTAHSEVYVANSIKNKAGLGDFIRIPWGNRTVRVSAKLPETNVFLGAYAGPGGSAAKGSSVIDVLTEDGTQCVKEIEHGFVVAPVVWFTLLDVTDTTILSCEMQSPPANQDVAVRFQAIADTTAGGAAFATARVTSKPAPIRVRLIE